MLGKVVVEGLKLTDADLEPCLYQILTSMGGSKRAQGIAKYEVIIQVNPIKLIDYTIVNVKVVVMQATLYDVPVGGAILYPLGITLDFWEETIY